MENESKKWYQSRSIIGTLVTMAAMILGMLGYGIGAEDQTQLVNLILELGGLVGAIVAIYGRIKASKKIGK